MSAIEMAIPAFDELIRRALETAGGSSTAFPEAGYTESGKDLDAALLADAARARGLPVLRLPDTMQVIGDGGRRVGFFQTMPWSVTALDRIASNDKDLTKRILRRRGLPVAAGSVATTLDEAYEFARALGFPVVVKPVAGFGGKGVTVGVPGEDDLACAWTAATDVAERVLVEECITSIDLRIMVVDGRAVAAALRVPAHVEGDGLSSIAELVDAKNRVREANPYLRHSPIEITGDVRRRLAELGMREQTVPERGQRVFLHYKANLGAGGDSHDVSKLVHASIARIAEQAAACFPSARHAGIDLLVERIDAPAGEQRVVVCEVNLNNDLPMHMFPLFGEPVDVADHVVAMYDRGDTVDVPQLARRPRIAPMDSATSAPSLPNVTEAVGSARAIDRHCLTRELERLGFDVRFRGRLIFLDRPGETSVAERSGTSIFAARLSRRLDALAQILADAGVPVCEAPGSGAIDLQMLLVEGREITTLDAENVGHIRSPVPGLAGVARHVWQLIGVPPLLAVTFSAVPTLSADGSRYAVSAIASDPVLARFAFPLSGEQVPVYEVVARVLADLPRHLLDGGDTMR